MLLLAGCLAPDAGAAQDPIALARAGTVAIEQQRFGDALDAFTAAAALQPGDASLCFGAGVAAFMLGQDDLAQRRFECALALKPDHLPAAMWLGDLHYRAGRLPEAISIYDTARLRSPNQDLEKQLALWRREYELQSRFHQVRTARFTALFERAADEALARDVVARLESAYWRIGRTLGVYPPAPVTVVLYTREQFADFTRLAEWSAAAYDGRIRVPLGETLERGDELDRVLSHELVHAVVVGMAGRSVPAWLSEGLATVLASGGNGEAQPLLVSGAGRPGLSTLHRGFIGLSRPEAELAYASAAHAVRRLLEHRGAATVVALLRQLGRGASFAFAFQQHIGMPYEEFAALVARD